MGWVTVDTRYDVSLIAGRVTARSNSGRTPGKVLATLPAAITTHDQVKQLRQLAAWLKGHDATCHHQVESWMVLSAPLPTGVIVQLWRDESWRHALQGLWVRGSGGDSGFLHQASTAGVTLITVDGDIKSIDDVTITIAHPAVIPDLHTIQRAAWRLKVTQNVDQLYRLVHHQPEETPSDTVAAPHSADSSSEEISIARHQAMGLGLRISGSYVTTTLRETGQAPSAGGLFAADAGSAGPDAAAIGVYAFTHPALDRVVAQLWAVDHSPAAVAMAATVGLHPEGDPVVVGYGRVTAAEFPASVVTRFPHDAPAALDILPRVDQIARAIAIKPGSAIDDAVKLSKEFGAQAPQSTPALLEYFGRLFLSAGRQPYAIQLLNRAQQCEAENGFTIDEDHRESVLKEYAAAGALSATQLSSYLRSVSSRVSGAEACDRTVRLAQYQVACGLVPTTSITVTLRKAAKAAGLDPAAVIHDYLSDISRLPIIWRTPVSWWVDHQEELRPVIEQHPDMLNRLLNGPRTLSTSDDLGDWLALLQEWGVLDGLSDQTHPRQPEGGAVGWFQRTMKQRGDTGQTTTYLQELGTIVEMMASRLREESLLNPIPLGTDLTLLDQLLSLDIRVMDPTSDDSLTFTHWMSPSPLRDLSAIVKDARFAPLLDRALREIIHHPMGNAVLQELARHPGNRSFLKTWVQGLITQAAAASSAQLAATVKPLVQLPQEFMELFPEVLGLMQKIDIPRQLAETLRGGMIDELHWPIWEKVISPLMKDFFDIELHNKWPYLIVKATPRRSSSPSEYQVLGRHGVYQAGEPDTPPVHDQPFDPQSGHATAPELPAAIAARFAAAPPGSTLTSWAFLPEYASDTLADGVIGAFGAVVAHTPDGLWWWCDLEGNTATIPGHHPPPSPGALYFPGAGPVLALSQHHPTDDIHLLDQHGKLLASYNPQSAGGIFAAGTPMVPPLPYWSYLVPRDDRGSRRLRDITTSDAAELIAAISRTSTHGQLLDVIHTALPEVTHHHLVEGIARIAKHLTSLHTELSSHIDNLRASASHSSTPSPEELPLANAPRDDEIVVALSGLTGLARYVDSHQHVHWNLPVHNRLITATNLRRTVTAFQSVAHHGPDPSSALATTALAPSSVPLAALLANIPAIAFRAAAPLTTPEHRETLVALLSRFAEFDSLCLTGSWSIIRFLAPDDESPHELEYHRIVTRNGVTLISQCQPYLTIDLPFGIGNEPPLGVSWSQTGEVPLPEDLTVDTITPLTLRQRPGWILTFLHELSTRGAPPWRPDAAATFAELTGVKLSQAQLIVAGLPALDNVSDPPAFLTHDDLKTLRIQSTSADQAAPALQKLLTPSTRRELVSMLLPEDPADLWTHGADIEAAATWWNNHFGRQQHIPDKLHAAIVRDHSFLHETTVLHHLRPILAPQHSAQLTVDQHFTIRHADIVPADDSVVGFDSRVLVTTIQLCAWIAHHHPIGDPVRAILPTVLAQVQARLKNPNLVLSTHGTTWLSTLRAQLGEPTAVTEDFVRYGLLVCANQQHCSVELGVEAAHYHPTATDRYTQYLHTWLDEGSWGSVRVDVALDLTQDPHFAAFLADPGDPVGGPRLKDGTWWPQNPQLSAPDIVAEAADFFGLTADAAALYLILLAMPDPATSTVKRWTGWQTARFNSAATDLTAHQLVIAARRARSRRELFLPGDWIALTRLQTPIETWKVINLHHGLASSSSYGLDTLRYRHEELEEMTYRRATIVPRISAAQLYRDAWNQIRSGNTPG